jgi:hypothetical protein
MKAMSVGAIALCLLFFACTKNDKPIEKPTTPPISDQKKVAVTFSATGFTQETTDLPNSKLARAADSMGNYVRYFWYLAYDNRNQEVSRQFQKSSVGSNFGTIKDSLQPGGPYTIVMFASPFNLAFNGPDTLGGWNSSRIPAKLHLDSAFLSFRVVDWYATKEAFYKKFTININNDTIVSTATLNRIVGKVEVNIQDAIATQNIDVVVDKESGYYRFNTNQCDSPFVEKFGSGKYITSFTRVSATKFERFFLNNKTDMILIITAYDGNHGIIVQRKVRFNNQWNKKVVVSGRLFGPAIDPNFGFKVSLNADWDADSTQLGF